MTSLTERIIIKTIVNNNENNKDDENNTNNDGQGTCVSSFVFPGRQG